MGFKLHEDKLPDLTLGDAFMVYLRIFFKDALRPQAPDVIGKRILRIKKELLTEASRDRVALVETASDALDAGSIIEKTGTALSKVIPAHTYSPKHPIKVAFLYNGFIKDSSWTADHEKGRLRLEQAGGGTIKTKCYEDCGSSEAFEKAADGQSTKIIIPSEIQGLAGLASSLTEIAKEDGKSGNGEPDQTDQTAE